MERREGEGRGRKEGGKEKGRNLHSISSGSLMSGLKQLALLHMERDSFREQ